MAKVTINGVDIEVDEGTPLITAADKAGVFIPRFCYHPDLEPVGNCRICQVEIEGAPKLAVSCMTTVKDGMVVRSDTDQVKKAVQGDLEFLLLNHPVDCPICDQSGECYLQDYYMAVGQHESRIPLGDKVRKRKVVDLGDMIVLDSERCVMCSRCIRFSDDVSGTNQFGFFQRGAKMEIGTFRDRPLDDPYSGNYADVCPVGALTSKDFRFNSRVWFLKRTDSVCPGCSTGCNIRVDHKEGQAYRFVPRRNPDVNASWMCDIGRRSYTDLNDPERVLSPMLKRDDDHAIVDWPEALSLIADRLSAAATEKGAASIVGLATPRSTCEELWSFRTLFNEVVGTPHLDYRVTKTWDRVEEREDQLLRRVDPQPNSRGAELLGLLPGDGGLGVTDALELAASGDVEVLYIQGPEVFTGQDAELIERALAGARFVVCHDTKKRDVHRDVDVVLPSAMFAEVDGTFVNYANRLQRIRRAYSPSGNARSGVEVFADLIEALTGEPSARTPRDVFDRIAAGVVSFSQLKFELIGPLGIDLIRKHKDDEEAA